MNQHAIALAEALIRRFDPLSLEPVSEEGRWKIGYGSKWLASGQSVGFATFPITADHADDLLVSTLAHLARDIDKLLPEGAADWQCAACLAFTYDQGLYAFKVSKILTCFQEGDLLGACARFGGWVYAGGRTSPRLTARRKAERDLFAGIGVAQEDYDDDPHANAVLAAPTIHE